MKGERAKVASFVTGMSDVYCTLDGSRNPSCPAVMQIAINHAPCVNHEPEPCNNGIRPNYFFLIFVNDTIGPIISELNIGIVNKYVG